MRSIIYYIALVATLGLSACTPAEALYMTFGAGSSHGSPALQAQAEKVAACESGDGFNFSSVNPGAVSPTNDHGMLQINAYYHRAAFERYTGQPWSQVYDPFWNAVYAKHLYDRLGWQPWTCRKVL